MAELWQPDGVRETTDEFHVTVNSGLDKV